QLTKLVALDRLAPGAPVTVVSGLVALTLVMNPGLAFGLLAGVPAGWRWIVVPLSLLALLVLFRVALRILPTGGWRERAAIGLVRVDGAIVKAAYRLRGGERIDVEVPPLPAEELVPEPVALSIVHEDEHVLVIDKPAGLVVHPGAGNSGGTLAAAVLAHAPAT